jgi:hypothetical protein
MKLSDYRGEKALDILADLIEPASKIFGDKEVAQSYQSGNKLKCVKVAIKNHKKEVIELLAVLDGEDAKTYEEKVTIFTVPIKLLQILNDPELMQAFSSQGQMGDATSSGSVSENIEE